MLDDKSLNKNTIIDILRSYIKVNSGSDRIGIKLVDLLQRLPCDNRNMDIVDLNNYLQKNISEVTSEEDTYYLEIWNNLNGVILRKK